MKSMKGPFKVVMTDGLFLSTEIRADYVEAAAMAQNIIAALDGPKVFVGVYDRDNAKIWSYELDKNKEFTP